MICSPTYFRSADESPLVSHILGSLRDACGADMAVGPDNAREVARAIEVYLECERGGEFVDSEYLVLLVSKALHSMGEQTKAGRMMVVGTGLVRPSEWEVSGRDVMWVLDLRQLSVRLDAPLEIVLLRSLNAVLSAVAAVWDDSSGRGVLGLRHVCDTAARLLGKDANHAEVVSLGEELRSTCTSRLRQIQFDRDWDDIPVVMNLDV